MHRRASIDALVATTIPSPTAADNSLRHFTEADVIALTEGFNALHPRFWPHPYRTVLRPKACLHSMDNCRRRYAGRRANSKCATTPALTLPPADHLAHQQP